MAYDSRAKSKKKRQGIYGNWTAYDSRAKSKERRKRIGQLTHGNHAKSAKQSRGIAGNSR